MRGDNYINLLDKVKCSPDFRRRMEEKLSADRTEVHEYYDVVRDVEKAPDHRRTKGFIPLFAAGAAIVCVFAVMVLSVKELPQDEEDRAAIVTEATTTEENSTEETTAPEKFGTVVDLFAANDWICGGVDSMPIEYVSSDSKSQKKLKAENCDILELREKIFNNDWSEITGFDPSNYYKIGTIMINQKGQISDGVNHFKLIENKEYEITETAKKAFVGSETFKDRELIPELFIRYSWEMELNAIRENIQYCADYKPFIEGVSRSENGFSLGRESVDIKPVIEMLLNAECKKTDKFDTTEYFDLGSILVNTKGQVSLPAYYNYSKGKKEPEEVAARCYTIDEDSAKILNKYIEDNFWNELTPEDIILKKVIQSSEKYNKLSADVKVQTYSLWNGTGNDEIKQSEEETYQDYLKRRKSISGEGELYIDLQNNTEKVNIEGSLSDNIPVRAEVYRDENGLTYKESAEGTYNIDKNCIKEHTNSYQDSDGVWHYDTYNHIEFPYLDYSHTAINALLPLSYNSGGYGWNVKITTEEEKKNSGYDIIYTSGDENDGYYSKYCIGLDEDTGIVKRVYRESIYTFEDGTKMKDIESYELENIRYDKEAKEIE